MTALSAEEQELATLATTDVEQFLYDSRTILEGMQSPETSLRRILANASDPGVKLSAVYCLATHYRRHSRLMDFRNIIESARMEMESNPRFKFGLLPMYYFHSPRPTTASMQMALFYAQAGIESYPNSSGLLNQYAELVLNLSAGDHWPGSPKEQSEHLRNAEAASRKSIALTSGSYGKYHAVCGRIVASEGRLVEAREFFQEAINSENPNRPDYGLRVGEYQLWQTRAEIDAKMAEVSEKGKEAVDGVAAIRASLIQILGLLTAVVAFVVSGANMANAAKSFQDAAGILITQGLVLTFVFGVFSVVFNTARWWVGLCVTLLACCALAGFLISFSHLSF